MSLRTLLARRRAGSIIALAALSVCSSASFGADVVKADNTDNLELGTAWGGGNTPTIDDVALFNSTLVSNTAFTLGANASWGGIRVANPAAPLSINGTATLTLRRFGIDMSAATQNLTINTPVAIRGVPGVYDWNVAAGRTLTLASVPVKNGQTNENTGIVRFSTTGTIVMGSGTQSYLGDNQNNPYAVWGNYLDWATVNAGVVGPVTHNVINSTMANPGLTGNVDVQGVVVTNVGNAFMDSLRFDAPGVNELRISANSRTHTPRGILVTANSGPAYIGPDGGQTTFIRPNRVSVTNTAFPIIQNSASDFTIGAVISNASSNAPVQPVKYGSGKLILTANNGYSGGFTLMEGSVQIGNGGAGGAFGSGGIVNNGAILFNRTGSLTEGNVISGTGSLSNIGPGEVILSGVNTFTGNVSVSGGGTLGVNALSGLGAASTTLTLDNGTFKYGAGMTDDLFAAKSVTIGSGGFGIDTNGNNVTFAGSIGNGSSGGLNKLGAGKLTLNGTNTYTGNTVVTAGTLAGTGSVAGALVVNNGTTVAPGDNGVGTFTTNGLTLDVGAMLDIEFGAGNDKINAGSGPLVINGGALTLLQEGSNTPLGAAGLYDIIMHTGAIGGTGLSALSVANPALGFIYTFQNSGSAIQLQVTQGGIVTGWAVNGGGSWGSAANWVNGIPNAAGDAALFNIALTNPSTVTLDGTRTVGGIRFDSAVGYTLSTGSLVLNNNTVPVAQVNAFQGSHKINVPVNVVAATLQSEVRDNSTLEISGVVSGAASGLEKLGGGTLFLSNSANTYTGATEVQGGTLQVAAIGSLGTNAALNLSGGGVVKYATGMTNDLSAAKTVTLGEGGGGIDTNGNNITFGTAISGTGGLVKAGAGKLTLTAANSYTGQTVVRGGTLEFTSNDQLGDTSVGAGLSLDGGALNVNTTIVLSDGVAPRALNVGANGGTVTVADGQELNIPGSTSGTGQLTKLGGGSLSFLGGSSRSGVTRIESGFVNLGTNGALGSGQVDLVAGTLNISGTRLNNTLNVIGSGVVSGGSGGGATDLTTVIGNGNLVVNVTTGVFDLEGDMSGFTGTLEAVNAGSGGVRLNGTALSSGMTLNLGANVTVSRRNTTTTQNIGALVGTGSLSAVTGGATGTTTWVIGGKNIDATFDGFIGDTLDGTTLAIIGPSAVTKVGTGTQTFTNTNFYTGITTVQAGTLKLAQPAWDPVIGGPTMSGLGLTPGGANIQGGKLAFDYTGGSSPASTIVPLLTNAFNNDGFLTGQIRNSLATSAIGLGYIDDTANSTFIVAAALYGDTNLDGTVNFDDLLKLAQNYDAAGSGKVWSEGDSTYNGIVNFDDLLKLAQNYGSSLAVATQFADGMGGAFASDWALALSTVPEPTSLGLIAGMGGLLARRRRD